MHSHLSIIGRNGPLALPPDASLNITDRNPMFNDVEMFSEPVQLPFLLNRSLLQNMDDVNSRLRPADVQDERFRILMDGIPLRSAVLKIQEGAKMDGSIDVNFESANKTFKDMIQDLKCRNVPVPDEVPIGEKIGDIQFAFTATVQYTVFYGVGGYGQAGGSVTSDVATTSGAEVFNPPVLGFSYPGICNRLSPAAQAFRFGHWEYTNPSATVNVPMCDVPLINTSQPYPQARYCNSRVCYAHHDYDADKKETSSNLVDPDAESHNGPEDYGLYWVLPANRPASGICFYVGYFLECLFRHLGVAYDISALTSIEDFTYMAFFTTACKFDERPATSPVGETNQIQGMTAINQWLDSRGCGGQVSFDTSKVFKTSYLKTVTASFGGQTRTYTVGQDVPGHPGVKVNNIQRTIRIAEPDVSATVNHMFANADNFPDAQVTEVIESLENTFGARFCYDAEVNKVTVRLLRDMFRSADAPVKLRGEVLKMVKQTDLIKGVRVKYGSESDPDEQQDNIRYGSRDYDTDFDYVDYPENRTVLKSYAQVVQKIDPTDDTVYVDPATGNAIRIKVDKEATTVKEMRPAAFEVGGYKGIEEGDCQDDSEEQMQELASNFQPVMVNDVNFRNGGAANPEDYQPLLVPFADDDMAREFLPAKLQSPFLIDDCEAYFTYTLRLAESYDPGNTDDGSSPLMTHNWGLAVGILRTGNGAGGLENFDPDYDGFGNWRWRDVADTYCLASDTMDPTGRRLGQTDPANAFSLKVRAYKPFRYKYVTESGRQVLKISVNPQEWSDPSWLIPCADDERDATGHITKRIRSRGYADVFLPEYIHFLLNRQPYYVEALMTAAELADIPNKWLRRFEIDGKVGWINQLTYPVDMQKGIGVVQIEFYAL